MAQWSSQSPENCSSNPATSSAFIVNVSAYWTERRMLIQEPGIGQKNLEACF